ncbi:MAG: N-6 DNA Methylase [Microgenomates group bacterium ADurb.Bin219]|nr:MAG: N-6 DNA Methylase [Microgenomates group bacterium ADurb.Bin219]
MNKQLLSDYLKEVYQKAARGDAREETFYPTLEKLISAFGISLKKKTEVTAQPKKSEAGNPDFRVWDGQSKIVGYIEAKHPSKRYLDEVESSEQLKRYLEAYPNILLTNFYEFRLYRNGVLWDKPVKISDYDLSKRLPEFPVVQHEEELIRLLSFFFDFSLPRVTHPRTLAEILAYKSGIMRDYVVVPTLEEDQNNYFAWLYQSFQKHLIKDLTIRDFADLFSQTFTYGLFIAKYQYEAQQTLFGKKVSGLPFTTKTAYDFIQKSFGILREVFKVVSTQDMPQNLKVIVDDIVDILNHTDIYKLLSTGNGKRDPIFHLYETFLLKYDKERKKQLGVYYTPLEVVSYIVNSTHALLKDDKLFNASDGLASYNSNSLEKSVTLLDPAVGTGTFFVEAIEKAIEEVKSKYSKSPDYISKFTRDHILSHFFAFEILIAPYVVSHLKVLFSLTKDGFEFTDEDGLKIFLTNTLEFHRKETSGFAGFFEQTLVTEQQNALEVKNKTPILIVIGNPPYSVSSQNEVDPETPFGKFYESYKEKVRKEERNIQPLSDDYIKFLAFAHWKVKQSGKGIVGMITNNSYLDGLIHRDMRQKLLEDFDLIYILNLHGDANRPQFTPAGKKDENVFDIRQGVTISLFVKPEKEIKKQIFYEDIVGSRDDKYQYLNKYNIKTSNWTKLDPNKPYWFFVPKKFKSEDLYQSFVSLEKIFSIYNAGSATGKDEVLTSLNKEELVRKMSTADESIFKLSMQNYKVSPPLIKKWLEELKGKEIDNQIYLYSYRPFDNRFILYNPRIVQRARHVVMKHLIRENIALLTMRQYVYSAPYSHAFVTNNIVDRRIFISNRGAAHVFPLWIHETNEKHSNQQSFLDDSQVSSGKTSNIKQDFLNLLSAAYKQAVSPEEVFYYIYAVLYSNLYRKKFEEFLKIDFPKVPFTKDYTLFRKVSNIGKELADLHLLNSPLLNNPATKFEGGDGEFVKKWHYDSKLKRIYINEKQFFTNVAPEVWDYFIGGYQVLDKWLKDRKDKSLSSEEINHYIKVIEALKHTLEIQTNIDKIYPEIEKSLISKIT